MNDLRFRSVPIDDPSRLPHVERSEPEEQRREALPIVRRYLRVIKRWKWLILGAVAVCTFLGLIVTLLTTPLYTATATLDIQRENYRIVQVEGVEPEGKSVDMEFYQTQYG